MSKEFLSNLVHYRTYAKYLPEEQRRESKKETIGRYIKMMTDKFPNLKEEIEEAGKEIYAGRVVGSMRALSDDTPIRTVGGWMKVGDVTVGTKLFDSFGDVTTVKKVFKFQNKKLNKVTFSDNSNLVACDDHLWIISTADDLHKNGGKTRVVDTQYIKDHLTIGKVFKRNNISIKNPLPINLPEKEVLLDPYILGHWLGDGYSSGYQYSTSLEDSDFFSIQYKNEGFENKQSESTNIWTWNVKGLSKKLRKYGLINNKHIPFDYLNGSVEQRLSLLQGLIDSDGCVDKVGRVHFSNTNIYLINGVKELLSSLGIKHTTHETSYSDKNKQTLFTIKFTTKLTVSRLPRKKSRLKNYDLKQTENRKVIKVEDVGPGNATCFEVDSPNHSFLAGKEMIVTHNCMQFAGEGAERRNFRIFNCSYLPIKTFLDFRDLFYVSMSGTGVGFSVRKMHVSNLPVIEEGQIVKPYVVSDDAEGWANSLVELLKNSDLQFDYTEIRPMGAPLSTGGTASGPKALIHMHAQVRIILRKAIGRQLTAFECHRICCLIADCVVVGGVRRGALISLFDYDNEEMLNCKAGSWWEKYPELARANNSAVVHKDDPEFQNKAGKVIDACFIGGQAEPGLSLTHDENYGWNPCFTGDTRILTENGWESFLELLDTEPLIHQDNRIRGVEENGKEIWNINLLEENISVKNLATNVRKTAENQDIFELTLNCGRKVKATLNHHFATVDGMLMLKDLKIGSEVLIPLPSLAIIDKDSDDFKLGYLLGLLYGDGCFIRRDEVKIEVWGEENLEEVKQIEEFVNYFIEKEKSNLTYNTSVSKNPVFNSNQGSIYGEKIKYTLSSSLLGQIVKNKGFVNKEEIFFLHKESKNFKSGFISGYFYADGHTEYNQKSKSLSLRVTSTRLKGLMTIQLLLQELGIFSRINAHKKAGVSLMPDSNRNLKEYNASQGYRLIIGGQKNCFNALEVLKLHEKDVMRITQIKNSNPKLYKQRFTSTVKSIEFYGIEDVYCLSENNRRTLIAEGITARRCHEIALREYGVCNLTEINAAKCFSKEEWLSAVKAATIFGTLQASFTDFYFVQSEWKKTADEDALLGVSITGQAENQPLLTDDNLKEGSLLTVKINEEWAKKIGINPAKRITTTKPSGTSSSWLGTTAGVHAGHEIRYLRRVRLDKFSALSKSLIKYFPEFIVTDPFNENDIIIQIPVKMYDNTLLRSQEGAVQCLDRVKRLYQNWILPAHKEGANTHNISLTINYHSHEKEPIKKWMLENKEFYYGISLIPYDGGDYKYLPYSQPPHVEVFEILDKCFKERSKNFSFDAIKERKDNTNFKGEVACAGGACLLD